MAGFKISRSRFRKVQGIPDEESVLAQDEPVEAIVRVNEPGYVPPGMKVRTSHAGLLTGELSTRILDDLERDPKVDSVSISRPLRIIE